MQDHLAFIALADAAAILKEHPTIRARLIGGLMMSIHVARWKLPPLFLRSTLDADVVAPRLAARVFEDIDLALDALGYQQESPYRYAREMTDPPVEIDEDREANPGKRGLYRVVLDLVQVGSAPSDGTPIVPEGSGELDPVAIIEAINRPEIGVEVQLVGLDGRSTPVRVDLADEASAVMLKAYSWNSRRAPRDAHDLWRSLEVAFAAGCSPKDFSSPVAVNAARIIRDQFSDQEPGMAALEVAGGPEVSNARISALVQRLFGVTG